jgi:hypothetical protein
MIQLLILNILFLKIWGRRKCTEGRCQAIRFLKQKSVATRFTNKNIFCGLISFKWCFDEDVPKRKLLHV